MIVHPLRPPFAAGDEEIFFGTHKIIGYKQLGPDDIEFPLNIGREIRKSEQGQPFMGEVFYKIPEGRVSSQKVPFTLLHVEWGLTTVDIPLQEVPEDIRKILEENRYFYNGNYMFIRGDDCGKTLTEMLDENPNLAIKNNLHFPENRATFQKFMHFLGLPGDCNYDDFANKYGGITRQEFIDRISL